MTGPPGPGQGPPHRRLKHRGDPARRKPGAPARKIVLLCCALLLAGCGGDAGPSAAADDPQILRVGLIPNVAPDEQRARYEPFGEHLEGALGMDVELFVASSYAGVVTALASDRVDVAYLGGLTYVQAEQQADVVPLVTEVDRETGTSKYESAVVVRGDAPFQTLDDVLHVGGTFAMGDVSSTSGSLYPRLMLVEAGARCSAGDLTSCPPLEEVVFTGGHDAAAQAVLQGGADAAGLELRILQRMERDGLVPAGSLRVLQTAQVEGYPWVARAALPEDLRQRVVEAFEAIEDPALLDLLRARGYVPVTAEDYEEVRSEAGRLGLLDG